jgi:hypothetical protein
MVCHCQPAPPPTPPHTSVPCAAAHRLLKVTAHAHAQLQTINRQPKRSSYLGPAAAADHAAATAAAAVGKHGDVCREMPHAQLVHTQPSAAPPMPGLAATSWQLARGMLCHLTPLLTSAKVEQHWSKTQLHTNCHASSSSNSPPPTCTPPGR